MVAASVGLMDAQTTQKQIVEEGGTGPFKSEVVGDASCPGFTVYRPQNLKEVVAKQGALPVIVYANGACFNHNVEMRLLLSEVASYGYVLAAIGPYDEEDVMAQWKGVLLAAYPETNDYGIYPLGTWDSQVAWVSQLNIWEAKGADLAPEGFQKGAGTVLCIGNGGCEFSMKNEDGTPDKSAKPKNNSCQDNILKLAKNSVEYLMSI